MANSPSDGPQAEYAALRAELLQCQQMIWNSLALELTATGVVFSFSLSSTSRVPFLLILPILTYTLTHVYVDNVERMMLIGEYIGNKLSTLGLGWERFLGEKAKSDHSIRRRWTGPGAIPST